MASIQKTQQQAETLEYIAANIKELKKLQQFCTFVFPDKVSIEVADPQDPENNKKKIKRDMPMEPAEIRAYFLEKGIEVAKEIEKRSAANSIGLDSDEEDVCKYFTSQETRGSKSKKNKSEA